MTPKKLRAMAKWLDRHAPPCDDTRAAIRVLREQADWLEEHPDA